jgi:hypothetical protein
VHRLEPVAHIRNGSADNHGHGVVHERLSHFVAHFNRDDALAACSSSWWGRWLAAHLLLLLAFPIDKQPIDIPNLSAPKPGENLSHTEKVCSIANTKL